MPKILDKEFHILIPEVEIFDRIKELALKISRENESSNPLFIAVLNGVFIFAADLLREIDIDAEISFIKVNSYVGTDSSGKINELIGLQENIKDRHIILLDDIVDTGQTIASLITKLSLLQPKSIKVCCLLLKEEAFVQDFKIDYFGFKIDNKFVLGYGLDYNGKGRNLKDIYVLSE